MPSELFNTIKAFSRTGVSPERLMPEPAFLLREYNKYAKPGVSDAAMAVILEAVQQSPEYAALTAESKRILAYDFG